MSHLRVIAPGFQTTVQDLGRRGFAHLGVSASGAADAVSLRLGNLLVGNAEDAPALEMTLVGGTFEFESGSIVALTGSDFGATLDGQGVPLWTSTQVKAGALLRCGSTRSGARCYFCAAGGFDVPPFLGSTSTHLLTSLGGFQGRSLRAGDRLSLHPSLGSSSFKPRRVKKRVALQFALPQYLRMTAGSQAELFSTEAMSLLTSSLYTVTEAANRMGLRLSGPTLKWEGSSDILTEGVPLGAIQVPPDGKPIILFVEHQTTGGYPKIAGVIAADIHAVGQLRPRDRVRFELISLERAGELLVQQEGLVSHDSLEFI